MHERQRYGAVVCEQCSSTHRATPPEVDRWNTCWRFSHCAVAAERTTHRSQSPRYSRVSVFEWSVGMSLSRAAELELMELAFVWILISCQSLAPSQPSFNAIHPHGPPSVTLGRSSKLTKFPSYSQLLPHILKFSRGRLVQELLRPGHRVDNFAMQEKSTLKALCWSEGAWPVYLSSLSLF